MSDGLSDAYAIERQVKAVIAAAANLGDALKDARDGHRGWRAVDVLYDANLQLKRSGYALVPLCTECGLPVRDGTGAVVCRDHKYA